MSETPQARNKMIREWVDRHDINFGTFDEARAAFEDAEASASRPMTGEELQARFGNPIPSDIAEVLSGVSLFDLIDSPAPPPVQGAGEVVAWRAWPGGVIYTDKAQARAFLDYDPATRGKPLIELYEGAHPPIPNTVREALWQAKVALESAADFIRKKHGLENPSRNTAIKSVAAALSTLTGQAKKGEG